MASSMAVRSSASMTTAGISVSPASRAARHRRSPGDNLVVAGGELPHGQGLDHAVLPDGVRQLL